MYRLYIYKKEDGWRLQKMSGCKGPSMIFGSKLHKKHRQLLRWMWTLRALSSQYLQGWRIRILSGWYSPVLTHPQCEKLFSLYPQVWIKSHLDAQLQIELKLLNYYIKSSCRCHTHNIILSYKSLQVNREVRMQFSDAHEYLQ